MSGEPQIRVRTGCRGCPGVGHFIRASGSEVRECANTTASVCRRRTACLCFRKLLASTCCQHSARCEHPLETGFCRKGFDTESQRRPQAHIDDCSRPDAGLRRHPTCSPRSVHAPVLTCLATTSASRGLVLPQASRPRCCTCLIRLDEVSIFVYSSVSAHRIQASLLEVVRCPHPC